MELIFILGACDVGSSSQLDQSIDADPADRQGGAQLQRTSVELPPRYHYCTPSTPCDTAIPRVNLCASGTTSCSPKRTTTVKWTVNDRPINTIAILAPPETSTDWQIVSGAVALNWRFAVPLNSAIMVLGSDEDVTLTYYDIVPTWGCTTTINFDASSRKTCHGSSNLFWYENYDLETTHETIANRLEAIAREEIAITGVVPLPFRAFLMPTEMAVVLGGEGNFAYGDGTITVNYGNPAFLDAIGGVLVEVSHKFAHEHAHLLFAQIAALFTGGSTCLNEGLADALGNFAGYVPDSDFGHSLQGNDFSQGCLAQTEIHDKGNCVFWNLKLAGYFNSELFSRLFAPGHVYTFDSCDMTSSATGNSYVVYLTEATGTDMSGFVTSIGLANAGSYAAARAALGL